MACDKAVELRLLDSKGVPEGSLISIRLGGTRRQAPLGTDRPYRFPELDGTQQMKVDVFVPLGRARLLVQPGSTRCSVKLDSDGSVDSTAGVVAQNMSLDFEISPFGKSTAKTGTEVSGKLDDCEVVACGEENPPAHFEQCTDEDVGGKIACSKEFSRTASKPALPPSKSSSGPRRHQAALQSQPYFESHGILEVLQTLLQAVIKEKPADPYGYIIRVLENTRAASAGCKAGAGQKTKPSEPTDGKRVSRQSSKGKLRQAQAAQAQAVQATQAAQHGVAATKTENAECQVEPIHSGVTGPAPDLSAPISLPTEPVVDEVPPTTTPPEPAAEPRAAGTPPTEPTQTAEAADSMAQAFCPEVRSMPQGALRPKSVANLRGLSAVAAGAPASLPPVKAPPHKAAPPETAAAGTCAQPEGKRAPAVLTVTQDAAALPTSPAAQEAAALPATLPLASVEVTPNDPPHTSISEEAAKQETAAVLAEAPVEVVVEMPVEPPSEAPAETPPPGIPLSESQDAPPLPPKEPLTHDAESPSTIHKVLPVIEERSAACEELGGSGAAASSKLAGLDCSLQDLDALRDKLQRSIVSAVADGRLAELLDSPVPAPAAPESWGEDVEAVRMKLQNAIASAAMAGRFTDILSSLDVASDMPPVQEARPAEVEPIAPPAKSLAQGPASGGIDSALLQEAQECFGRALATGSFQAVLEASTGQSLAQAAADGSLEKAFSAVQADKTQAAGEFLIRAAADGSLEKFLTAEMGVPCSNQAIAKEDNGPLEQPGESSQEENAIRRKIGELLIQGAADGVLEEHLAAELGAPCSDKTAADESHDSPDQPGASMSQEVTDAHRKLRELFSKAVADGNLEKVLAAEFGASSCPNKVVAPTPQMGTDVRRAIGELLRKGVAEGVLDNILAAELGEPSSDKTHVGERDVSSDQPGASTSQVVTDVRRAMGELLMRGVADGVLDSVLAAEVGASCLHEAVVEKNADFPDQPGAVDVPSTGAEEPAAPPALLLTAPDPPTEAPAALPLDEPHSDSEASIEVADTLAPTSSAHQRVIGLAGDEAAGDESARDGLPAVRSLACELLSKAAMDGRLADALLGMSQSLSSQASRLEASDVDEVSELRKDAGAFLLKAQEEGHLDELLEGFIQEHLAGRALAEDEEENQLREQVRDILMGKALSGELEHLLSEVGPPEPAGETTRLPTVCEESCSQVGKTLEIPPCAEAAEPAETTLEFPPPAGPPSGPVAEPAVEAEPDTFSDPLPDPPPAPSNARSDPDAGELDELRVLLQRGFQSAVEDGRFDSMVPESSAAGGEPKEAPAEAPAKDMLDSKVEPLSLATTAASASSLPKQVSEETPPLVSGRSARSGRSNGSSSGPSTPGSRAAIARQVKNLLAETTALRSRTETLETKVEQIRGEGDHLREVLRSSFAEPMDLTALRSALSHP